MTRQEIVSFFANRQDLWQSRNPDAMAEGYARDTTVVSPMHGVLRGRDAVRDAFAALFDIFPDWDFRGEDVLVDGNRIAQPFSATATHVGDFMGLAGTNRRFQIQGVRLFTMADGLILHERRLYDFTGLLIQIGVLRSKPAKE